MVKDIKQGRLKKVEVIDNKILATYENDKMAISYKEPSDSFLKTLRDSKIDPDTVNLVIKDTQGSSSLLNLLGNLIPILLMVAFFIFIFKQAKGAQDSVFSFGQAKTKRFTKDMPKITFNDVAGVNEAKNELEEVLEVLASHRGRQTELITVYISAGYDVNVVQKQLEAEKSTSKNIKSTSTRKNVTEALEKIVRHLKGLKKTPENGLAVFCGNVAKS